MSDLIFARSPFTIKHTGSASTPTPVFECPDTEVYGSFANYTNFSVNSSGVIVNGTVTDNASGASLTITAVTSTSGASSFPVVYTATTVKLRVTHNIPSGFTASSHTCEIEVTQAAATPTQQVIRLFDFSQGTGSNGMTVLYTDPSNNPQTIFVNEDNNKGANITVKYPVESNIVLSWNTAILPFTRMINAQNIFNSAIPPTQ